jgi:putative transposase
MALRWTAARMMEAAKGFRRLKAYKHLPVLRAALAAHQSKYVTQRVEHDADAASTAMPASPTSTKSGAFPA